MMNSDCQQRYLVTTRLKHKDNVHNLFSFRKRKTSFKTLESGHFVRVKEMASLQHHCLAANQISYVKLTLAPPLAVLRFCQ